MFVLNNSHAEVGGFIQTRDRLADETEAFSEQSCGHAMFHSREQGVTEARQLCVIPR
jgi:hypothetical protein